MQSDFEGECTTPPFGGRSVKAHCQGPSKRAKRGNEGDMATWDATLSQPHPCRNVQPEAAGQSKPSEEQVEADYQQEIEFLPETAEDEWFLIDVGRIDLDAVRKDEVSVVAKRLISRLVCSCESPPASCEFSHTQSRDIYMNLARDSQGDQSSDVDFSKLLVSRPSHHRSGSDFGSVPLRIHVRAISDPPPTATPTPQMRSLLRAAPRSRSLPQIYPNNPKPFTPEEKRQAVRNVLHSYGFV
eukprot:gb/GEZN01007998.1/.p1 GENE.gb/GEZN01007998.1/~~gb/GEZN01007998.1/.p1  ORF type:complete len:242 (+),score=19.83 gb/GEZN01007998.1/:120-845(+)